MANEVRIKLTDEQKAKIKEGTGKEMDEIRVGHLGNNPAVTPATSAKIASARVQAAPRLNATRAQAAPRVQATRVQAAPRLNATRAQAAPKILNARSTKND